MEIQSVNRLNFLFYIYIIKKFGIDTFMVLFQWYGALLLLMLAVSTLKA